MHHPRVMPIVIACLLLGGPCPAKEELLSLYEQQRVAIEVPDMGR